MTKPNSSKPTVSSTTAVIVFGLDPTGKPKAGRFPGKDATLARKAALALKLAVCKVNRPRLVELVTRIPPGRLHAQGRAFLPFIRPDLYQELAAAANPSMAAAAKLGPNVSMAPEAKPPKDRTSIAAGDLVLCSEGVEEGYWEAIVTERDGDNLVCRFRDYPRLPLFRCTVQAIALMYGG
ncbi:hypothetical protein J4G48_0006235 [Bradyrhizobium barranii subsp. apii]|uniref:hypothetical protein n=1 Tax=Bradyrhizobium barranii TaxID=2992140 RepID=UPI001CD4B362|nr:hypothetical protein [Bradyrhizobium barranii]UPT97702.1 hypothetical protein J4G48_0006235 [Bradyrhizobium barranii subsp. apii]